jgi:hypothetical protein
MRSAMPGKGLLVRLLFGCAVVLAAGCGGTDQQETPAATAAPASSLAVDIVSPQPNSTVKGNVVDLKLAPQGIQIVKADGDTSGKTGHFHVFLDRTPPPPGAGIPKETGIVHSADDPIRLSGLTVGKHRLVVVLGDGAHRRIGTTQAETTVTFEGPAVQASAPAVVPNGKPAVVTLTAQGLDVVKANGDTSGKTGHFHLFVDRPVSPAGQPIPVAADVIHTAATTVAVPGLAPGEHTITVVAGDGLHVPLSPPVEAKVSFTVGSQG